MRISSKDYFSFLMQLVSGHRARHELFLAHLRKTDIALYYNNKTFLRILDLANGRLRPQSLILKSSGHSVIGIDLQNQPIRNFSDLGYILARRIFSFQIKAPSSKDNILCGNVESLPFEDESFDLVTSVAAFEHFNCVPAVISELHRVIRKEGIIWVCIHLFTSPSGGHTFNLMQIPLRSIPHAIDPWDHLRNRKLPFLVPLNQWRISQYLHAFAANFNIIKHYCAIREGEQFLTKEIKAELCQYSWEELTCGAYVIVARKS
jgi:SAM-dependent methyltransferase